MAKETEIHITIELEREPEPSVIDTFAYHFLKTLSYWVGAFLLIGFFGLIGSIII